MHEATIIYPHQLFTDSPAVAPNRVLYLVEEPLLLTHNPIHRQKLLFHKLSLDAYERDLRAAGYAITRLTIAEHPTTKDVFARLTKDGVERMHVVDTTDNYLEQAIAASGIERVWYESPLFMLEKDDAIERYHASKRFMASFYKQLRKDFNILIDDTGKPIGGHWSFDADNRQKIPKDTKLPTDIAHFGNSETSAAEEWVATVAAEQYGEAGCWLPYTREGAQKFLHEFLRERFMEFGPYEDAMHTGGVRLWHSALSPLLNVGLLSPQEVLEAALAYAEQHDVPLNSLEGFVRQVLGWREFIRASYECDGRAMRCQNFFNHTRGLPESFWEGTTGINPVDHVIGTALQHGYTHHIERLMVMGNFMLLVQLDPNEVYRWFMGMYVDAYDWVMVPNVYGMSQFADGGSFATKPYISGANYIKKMSNFPTGEWEATWTALYWHFIATHQEYFASNHRLSMMPRTLARMDEQTRAQHMETARQYLQNFC
jgi:deoxyribodipyrimidine photolyase-related protein